MSDEAARGRAGDRQTATGQTGGASPGTLPGPDAMLGMWSAWMQAASTSAQSLGQSRGQQFGQPRGQDWTKTDWGKALTGMGGQWWQAAPDALAGTMLANGPAWPNWRPADEFRAIRDADCAKPGAGC